MRIMLVADVANWAFDRDVSAIIQYLPQYDLSKGLTATFSPELLKQYDHVHFMNWWDATKRCKQISGGVSSHNFELRHLDISKKLFPQYKALVATSRKLYDKVKDSNENVFCAQGGVHEDLFVPTKKKERSKFVIGWVGQIITASSQQNKRLDIKGYSLILKPLMEQLKEHKDIEFKLLTTNYIDAMPYEEMPKFYEDVDVQICTSIAEGAPNPMFEAAACGKALITTKVGAISESIEEGKSGFMIPTYNATDDLESTINAFKEKILFLKNNKDVCESMGLEGRRIIEEGWTWKKRAQQWIPFFEHIRSQL